MTPEELRARLTAFAVAVTRFCKPLFSKPELRNIADQLGRSLLKEAREIVAILSASRVTASRGLNRQSSITNRE